MKKQIMYFIGLLAMTMPMLQSCTNNTDYYDNGFWQNPTALVTVVPTDDGGFVMNLNSTTKLVPSNVKKSPYDKKEVRAIVSFRYDDMMETSPVRSVTVNSIDSIRTKLPVVSQGADGNVMYGNDAVEIVKDWVTVGEDGYLTLRIRTKWGMRDAVHELNLLTDVNPENPYEVELRHNANGDISGDYADALIAFNLNGMPRPADGSSTIKLKLNWLSFEGSKSTEFEVPLREY